MFYSSFTLKLQMGGSNILTLCEKGLRTHVLLDKKATQVTHPSRFAAFWEQKVEQATQVAKVNTTVLEQTEYSVACARVWGFRMYTSIVLEVNLFK